MEKKLILYVCRGNRFRSAVAAQIHNIHAKKSRAESAGFNAKPNFAEYVKEIMDARGTPLEKEAPTKLTEKMCEHAHKIIVFCSQNQCPESFLKKHINKTEFWNLPKSEKKEEMEKIVELVEKKVLEILKQID